MTRNCDSLKRLISTNTQLPDKCWQRAFLTIINFQFHVVTMLCQWQGTKNTWLGSGKVYVLSDRLLSCQTLLLILRLVLKILILMPQTQLESAPVSFNENHKVVSHLVHRGRIKSEQIKEK